MEIEQRDPAATIRGLLEGEGIHNRVGNSFIHTCPHCDHRLRIKWRNLFHHMNERSNLKPSERILFDARMTDYDPQAQGFIDFHCPRCSRATRIIFSVDAIQASYRYEIQTVFIEK